MKILGTTEAALCMLTGFALSYRAINSLRDGNCTNKKRAKMELALGVSALVFPILSNVFLKDYFYPQFELTYSCKGSTAALNPETNCATRINGYSLKGGYRFQPGLTDTEGKLECRSISFFGAEACKKWIEEAFREYKAPMGILDDYKITPLRRWF
jgi:hypothetical protein